MTSRSTESLASWQATARISSPQRAGLALVKAQDSTQA